MNCQLNVDTLYIWIPIIGQGLGIFNERNLEYNTGVLTTIVMPAYTTIQEIFMLRIIRV